MHFKNRKEAADLLAVRLQRFRDHQPLVLGVSRGGVALARGIADRLGGEVDVMLVGLLRHCGQSESESECEVVDETGREYVFRSTPGVTTDLATAVLQDQLSELRRRRTLYSSVRPAIPATGRRVIVVDEGIASGFCMAAAIRAVRGQRPRRVVAAAPVASRESLALVSAFADETICLHVASAFQAVDDFFSDLSPVSDEDVLELLSEPRMPGTRRAVGRHTAADLHGTR